MRKQITTAIAILFTVVGMVISAQAQGQVPVVLPPGQQYPMPPQQQNDFYFGVNVQLIRGHHGTSLRITSVTPGSPASQAGLEYGDEIRSINGRGFSQARDSYDAVRMMKRFVSYGGHGRSIAQMMVRNVRNGQYVSVTVYPVRRGWGGPTPPPVSPALPVNSSATPNYQGYQAANH